MGTLTQNFYCAFERRENISFYFAMKWFCAFLFFALANLVISKVLKPEDEIASENENNVVAEAPKIAPNISVINTRPTIGQIKSDNSLERNKRQSSSSCPYFDAACDWYWGGYYSYRCADGYGCVSDKQTCNTRNQCGDLSDELCSSCEGVWYDEEICVPAFSAQGVNYRCRTMFANIFYVCVNAAGICDGTEDCHDGSDEAGCGAAYLDTAPNGCYTIYGSLAPYRCYDDSYCLSISQLCDGGQNCLDNSDEHPSLCP